MLQTLKEYWKVILFGFIAFYFSSIGQASLIAQFIPSLQHSLKLTLKEISLIYTVASIFSALILPTIGRMIDSFSTMIVIITSSIFLILGISELGLSQNAFMLFIGIFFIRGPGQISISMAATTYINKYFSKNQGKIIGLAILGRSLGWATLPTIVIILIEKIGWRQSAFFLGFTLIFALVWMVSLIKKNTKNIEKNNPGITNDNKIHSHGNGSFKIEHFPIIIAFAINPLVLTGLLFHQEYIREWKGMSVHEMSYAFPIFAIMQLLSTTFIGPIVDRVSATKLLPLAALPLCLSILSLSISSEPIFYYIYATMAGLGVGINSNIRDIFWTEQVNVLNLGYVKGIDSSISVFAAAISPLIFAQFFDSFERPHILMFLLFLLAVFSLIVSFNYANNHKQIIQNTL